MYLLDRDGYLLDSNVLIDAATRYYPFDVFPGLWEWLDQLIDGGEVASVDMVFQELTRRQDALSQWAKARQKAFVRPNGDSAGPLRLVGDWVMHPDRIYSAAARREFLAVADHQLVALALQHRAVIVTSEEPAPRSGKRVKIPDACRELGVECISFPQLLNRMRPRFVLPP